jgi:hypothetical protein
MSTVEVVNALAQLNNAQRLEVIEAASRLIREDLAIHANREEKERRLREAARRLAPLYEPGGELAEWNELDGEDVLDDYLPR